MSDPMSCMIVWEEFLRLRESHTGGTDAITRAKLCRVWDDVGVCAMRVIAIHVADAVDQSFGEHAEDHDVSFDWEYVPVYVAAITSFDPLILPLDFKYREE